MNKVKSSILAGLFAFCLLIPNVKKTSLTDIANPHLGIYECTQAQLGSKDLLSSFSLLRLELKDEENYSLCYQEKDGERKTREGKYAYDKERGVLTLLEAGGFQKEFPFSEGKLTISFPVGNRMAILQFRRK